MRADLADRRHHLRLKSGWWQVRFSVFQGQHFKSRRVVLALGTRDEEEARQRRDVILRALAKSEVLIADEDIVEDFRAESPHEA